MPDDDKLVDLTAVLREVERDKARHPSRRGASAHQADDESDAGPVRSATGEDMDRLRAQRAAAYDEE